MANGFKRSFRSTVATFSSHLLSQHYVPDQRTFTKKSKMKLFVTKFHYSFLRFFFNIEAIEMRAQHNRREMIEAVMPRWCRCMCLCLVYYVQSDAYVCVHDGVAFHFETRKHICFIIPSVKLHRALCE